MPSKTERILSYLPGTFRPLANRSALRAIAQAFGQELLQAENSLVNVMLAHWVDYADKDEQAIEDLAAIASLYGLAPRPDERVEAFREHLKRYVRTFLEGTVTVQGLLRVTAEALGLHIADAYEDLDTWWTRDSDTLTEQLPCGNDAAQYLLGFPFAEASGRSAEAARVTGSVDLSHGVDLRPASFLRLEIEDIGPEEIDLVVGAADPARVSPDEIVDRINLEMGVQVAYTDGRHVVLIAPSRGPESQIEVQYVPSDAAEQMLGLAPRTYRGTAAQAATVTRTVDLSEGTIDLGEAWYLRVTIDGRHVAEIDCARFEPQKVTLDQLTERINQAFDMEVASHDGKRLTLTSPSTGSGSTIRFEPPAAQEATRLLFGPVPAFVVGRDAQPARFTSRRDLSAGVDLNERGNIQLQIDEGGEVTIHCAGVDPAATKIREIVEAINSAVGKRVATHDGHRITITSPSKGRSSEIVIGYPPEADATEEILGIGPRIFHGTAPAQARILGERDLGEGINLSARHLLQITWNGGTPQIVDLRKHVQDGESVTLNDLRDAINQALEGPVATHDGERLILITPESGSARSLVVAPIQDVEPRRFTTRAKILDEAAPSVFGFLDREACGTAATNARLAGKKDLSRSVDLRQRRFLRLTVDDHRTVDIDCAGLRPAVTTLREIVDNINAELKDVRSLRNTLEALDQVVADDDGRGLVLISPSVGARSRIKLETPHATDALPVLLDVEPGTVEGEDATRVRFTGTVDLSDGVDLRDADRICIGVDGQDPVEIPCTGADPASTSLSEIVDAVNDALAQPIASADREGRYLQLASRKAGEESQLVFEVPEGGPDASETILGFTPPRSYHGADAASARITGERNLSGGINLEVSRFLRLGVDGGDVKPIDCAADAASATSVQLHEIEQAINEAVGETVASDDGQHLILTSPQAGSASSITLEAHADPEIDARGMLLGDVADEVRGQDPTPAVITGTRDLRTPVNLNLRRQIRLSVDGSRAIDIDVSGPDPNATFLDEIVAAINQVFPDVASGTETDRLQLVSTTSGAGSHLSLQPLRYLQVMEYPLHPQPPEPQLVRHGDAWTATNEGAAEVSVEGCISAPHGTYGPALVNEAEGWGVRLFTHVYPGDVARVWPDHEAGLRAEVTPPDGEPRPVPGDRIRVGPLGVQTWVPSEDEWPLLGGGDGQPAHLQLNNPLAPGVVVLRPHPSVPPDHEIRLQIQEHDFETDRPGPLTPVGAEVELLGRVRAGEGSHHLVDQDGAIVAELWPGPHVRLAPYKGRVVTATGPYHDGEPPVLIARKVIQRFDVTVRWVALGAEPERYTNVTIGNGTSEHDSLVWQLNDAPAQQDDEVKRSELVRAQELDKSTALRLPRGRSRWRYMDCEIPRFDEAAFGPETRFPGCECCERGIFDVSHLAVLEPREPAVAVFAPLSLETEPQVEVRFHWESHRLGACVVILPADLPARFGGYFDQARFGQEEGHPETFLAVTTERTGDEAFDEQHYVMEQVNTGFTDEGSRIDVEPSSLVEARSAALVPQGFREIKMPNREPQFLTQGATGRPAKIYLVDDQLEGKGYILLEAVEPGAWGNEISVTSQNAGPGMYDLSITYRGATFESARKTALLGHSLRDAEEHLPALMSDLLKPGPIGVLQAKAAGVAVRLDRDRAAALREAQGAS
jgi:hypothetical protein